MKDYSKGANKSGKNVPQKLWKTPKQNPLVLEISWTPFGIDITMPSETIPESGSVHPNVQHGGGTTGKVQQKRFQKVATENVVLFDHLEFGKVLARGCTRQTMAAMDAWKHSNFLCNNYILNGLDNALYNVYGPMINAKALWESLERKYKTEDASSKELVVGKFLDFKIMDSKTVISQVQEFQGILHDIHAEGKVLGESFKVAALIENLPPTWKDFKNYLKHKRKEMKLEDLIVRLRIEEDNRQSKKKVGNYHQEDKANVVEQVIGRNGAPVAVLLTAAYCKFPDNAILNSGAAKTCIGSGHSGRVSSGEAAQIKARFLD
ncbi:hypothetical protein RJ639_042255 [Escallonia herrerae]|uniref:Uncharacterized protein n=1 Tax=Escallonia herrerae TaxID=1293975 RepID=A0AA89B653_9ASTE|nr:hypothetical protein RJ639_042255 [Escallonia herrerae]